MTPTRTRRGGKLYRYYVSADVLKRDADACTMWRIPAAEIESAVIEQVRRPVHSPEMVVRRWRAARHSLEASRTRFIPTAPPQLFECTT
jgi:hypothetical protein